MNVRENINFLMVLISLCSIPVTMVSSSRNRFEEFNVNNNVHYFMHKEGQGMTGHELTNLNARNWLGTQTKALQDIIDGVDVDSLKLDDAQMLNKKTEELRSCMNKAVIDTKLLYRMNNRNGIQQTKKNHRNEQAENFCTDLFCCTSSLDAEDEKNDEAMMNYMELRNAALQVINKRMSRDS